MRSCILLVVLAGCDGVFGLTHLDEPTADGMSVDSGIDSNFSCTAEMFTGGIPELLVHWDRFETAGNKLVIDQNMLVPQILTTGVPGDAYVRSNQRFDMTGASASVELIDVIEVQNGNTYFSIDVNDNNVYLFIISGGSLSMFAVGATAPTLTVPYDPIAHRYLRFEHDGTLRFLTSVNGTDWTVRHSIPVVIPVESMLITIGAGTYTGGISTPAEARFDNFELCQPL